MKRVRMKCLVVSSRSSKRARAQKYYKTQQSPERLRWRLLQLQT
jgi:hypothetical protein